MIEFQGGWSYKSTRGFGSAGFWLKMWDSVAVGKNTFTNDLVRVSLGFRQGLQYGFSFNMNTYNWPQMVGYTSGATDARVFGADYVGVLVAPYTGQYQFFANADDSLKVYGAPYISGTSYGAETLLISVSSYTVPADFVTYAAINRSPTIYLRRGSRYKLRIRLINTGGADNIHVAMRVDPTYNPLTGNLVDGEQRLNGMNGNQAPEMLLQESATPLQFSDTFLRHHSLKDIQNVSVSAAFQREVQVHRKFPLLSHFPQIILLISPDGHDHGYLLGDLHNHYSRRGVHRPVESQQLRDRYQQCDAECHESHHSPLVENRVHVLQHSEANLGSSWPIDQSRLNHHISAGQHNPIHIVEDQHRQLEWYAALHDEHRDILVT